MYKLRDERALAIQSWHVGAVGRCQRSHLRDRAGHGVVCLVEGSLSMRKRQLV